MKKLVSILLVFSPLVASAGQIECNVRGTTVVSDGKRVVSQPFSASSDRTDGALEMNISIDPLGSTLRIKADGDSSLLVVKASLVNAETQIVELSASNMADTDWTRLELTNGFAEKIAHENKLQNSKLSRSNFRKTLASKIFSQAEVTCQVVR